MKHLHQTDTTRRAGPQPLRVHFEITGPIHVPVLVAHPRNKFPGGAKAWRSMACNLNRMISVQRETMLPGTTHLVGTAYRPRTHTNREESPEL